MIELAVTSITGISNSKTLFCNKIVIMFFMIVTSMTLEV